MVESTQQGFKRKLREGRPTGDREKMSEEKEGGNEDRKLNVSNESLEGGEHLIGAREPPESEGGRGGEGGRERGTTLNS
jgi:hypothetical protein